MKQRERQRLWRETRDWLNEFERRVSVVFHYADQIGYPSSSRSEATIGRHGGDPVGELASSIADGHAPDPSVAAAKKLEAMMVHLRDHARKMVQVIDSVEPAKPIPAELMVECMAPGCRVTKLQGPLIKGFCRRHYDRNRRR